MRFFLISFTALLVASCGGKSTLLPTYSEDDEPAPANRVSPAPDRLPDLNPGEPPQNNAVPCTSCERLYVDCEAGESSSGSDWQAPLASLQEAVDIAEEHGIASEIWIKAGVCRASQDEASIAIIPVSLEIIGGFAGTESAVPAVPAGITRLSGDVQDNDLEDDDDDDFNASRTDNSIHLLEVRSDTTHAILRRLQLEKANALRDQAVSGGGLLVTEDAHVHVHELVFHKNVAISGAAITASDAELVVTDSVFTSNRAGLQGGGIFAERASVSIADCTFQNNEAPDGAGLRLESNSELSVVSSTFDDNWAYASGGGVSAEGASVSIERSAFSHNHAATGGALSLRDSADALIDTCTFYDNDAYGPGGAIEWMDEDSELVITSSAFIQNDTNAGGAVHAQGNRLDIQASAFADNTAVIAAALRSTSDSTTVHDTEFHGNQATKSVAGAVEMIGGESTWANVSLIDNEAAFKGAALLLGSAHSAQLVGVTVAENTSPDSSVEVSFGSHLDATNSLLGTSEHSLVVDDESTASTTACCSRQSLADWGSGNITFTSSPLATSAGSLLTQPLQVADSACRNIGIASQADEHTPDWQEATTNLSAETDTPPVDAGAHVSVDEVQFHSLSASADPRGLVTVHFTMTSGTDCILLTPTSHTQIFVEPGEISVSDLELTKDQLVHVACWDESGRVRVRSTDLDL